MQSAPRKENYGADAEEKNLPAHFASEEALEECEARHEKTQELKKAAEPVHEETSVPPSFMGLPRA